MKSSLLKLLLEELLIRCLPAYNFTIFYTFDFHVEESVSDSEGTFEDVSGASSP